MFRSFSCLLAVFFLVACGPSPREGCENSGCHGVAGEDNGIEEIHPGRQLLCTSCHGGDPTADTAEAAHVAPAPAFVAERRGYLRNLSVNELDEVDPAYLRFENPGDFRVAGQSCGSTNPEAAGSDCHQELVESSRRSVMSTFVGHFNGPRFLAGMQERPGELGSITIEDPGFTGEVGTVPRLLQANPPPEDAPQGEVSTLMDHYLVKNCTHCHAESFGRNDARGNFRSSGCSSCHMVYDNDGVSQSSDPSAVTDRPPHPVRHELTTMPSGEQCEHCHFQGARIGLQYRGVVEWGLSDDPPFPNIGESLHNHPPEFYLQADTDPAYQGDLHYYAGLECVDCHQGRDVHGDGRIYSTAKFQVAVRCENCHGNVDEPITEGRATPPLVRGGTEPTCQPTSGDGDTFWNCAGDTLRGIFRDDAGVLRLRLSNGSGTPAIPQVNFILSRGDNENMIAGMGRDPATGFSHTEVIECHGCHTGYRQYCFGCHVDMDYSQTRSDLLTGRETIGAEITTRSFVELDMYLLGQNHRGKIASFCPSMQVFLSATGSDGTRLFENRTRTTASGRVGFNFAVDFPHVTSRTPRPCVQCHANQDDACSTNLALETFGFGTGRYMWTDDTGATHDLTQLLAPDGTSLYDFSHVGQGPVPMDMMQRALDTCVF